MSNIKHFFFKALFCASLFPSVNTPMALCANSHDIEALPEPQQQRKVTGVVTDLKGEPIIGANVVVKGSTNGTITDIDGNFSLGNSEFDTSNLLYWLRSSRGTGRK